MRLWNNYCNEEVKERSFSGCQLHLQSSRRDYTGTMGCPQEKHAGTDEMIRSFKELL